ncbi:MAG: hypothetical protein J6K41_11460 [Paraprevotella sp.]|nr:hypothetical protein [Paraprevotella sp.]
MRNKKLNYNRQIMLGVMALAVAVLVVVVAFWVWCFPNGTVAPIQLKARYTVVFTESFGTDSTQVYLNDSLVFDGCPSDFSLPLSCGNGEDDVLMVADAVTDVLYTFPLEAGKSRVCLTREGREVKMQQEEAKKAASNEKKQ